MKFNADFETQNFRPHYNLNLRSIAVNGQILPIDSSVFSTSNTQGTIIDSGTTLAYLAEEAYGPFINAVSIFCLFLVKLIFMYVMIRIARGYLNSKPFFYVNISPLFIFSQMVCELLNKIQISTVHLITFFLFFIGIFIESVDIFCQFAIMTRLSLNFMKCFSDNSFCSASCATTCY